jgi:hypothetical protein
MSIFSRPLESARIAFVTSEKAELLDMDIDIVVTSELLRSFQGVTSRNVPSTTVFYNISTSDRAPSYCCTFHGCRADVYFAFDIEQLYCHMPVA